MWRKIGIVVAAFGTLLSIGTNARPKRKTAVSLTLSVFDDAALPPSVLSGAQARAESVLSTAGITLTWLDCSTSEHKATDIGCAGMTYPTHLSVRLVKNKRGPSKTTFGQSFLDGQGAGIYAEVYVTALACSREMEVVSQGDLLGYVVAHELGHLLLGPDSHSPSGVMRAVWQFNDLKQAARGRLAFTPEQLERKQSRFLLANTQGTATSARIGR